MNRVDGWEERFKRMIETHRDLPSLYGTSDCFQICNDAVFAVAGEYLFRDIYYTTPQGAAKLLSRLGFKTVEDAFASKLETVPVSMAQRGDIGVMENANGEICGGVFTALGFMVRNSEAIEFISHSQVKTAFKVAR